MEVLRDLFRIGIGIIYLLYLWMPKDSFAPILHNIIDIVAIPLMLILFLDFYNPLERYRIKFIWRLKAFIWGNPNN